MENYQAIIYMYGKCESQYAQIEKECYHKHGFLIYVYIKAEYNKSLHTKCTHKHSCKTTSNGQKNINLLLL